MIIALAALLLCGAPNAAALPKAAAKAAAAATSKPLPAAPMPNANKTDGKADALEAVAQPETPAAAQNSQALDTIHVPPPALAKQDEILRVDRAPSRRTWLLLSIADHSAAVFDAYSTRASISRGAVEADPLVRPFANSNGLYAAIQVAPLALDFVARRMQRSRIGLLRRTWWLPQSASTGLFVFAGAHDLTLPTR